ncbi:MULTISPECIES: hypothetical protein [unclassified Brucella]|uniref:hypothetical protein n=1 Tax=unclassified Brucella TaxID=2632610 RepID=UPI0012AE0D86|nr:MULTISPECIES: hypothetical protein [unclassified Brucella]MRN43440.1 hypothetical protein [Brucella sp. 09RB8913]MRN59414.1 hypothetical protein [Brucella sp. 09RB8918]MRN67994.1 hypothetical protein [Brucella sp. 10RB9213]
MDNVSQHTLPVLFRTTGEYLLSAPYFSPAFAREAGFISGPNSLCLTTKGENGPTFFDFTIDMVECSGLVIGLLSIENGLAEFERAHSVSLKEHLQKNWPLEGPFKPLIRGLFPGQYRSEIEVRK